jgi:medium-chain acyl-[acyl-carrier-protein] hydrolase
MAHETPILWSETYKVSSYLVNLRGRAGLTTLLNFIQDAGWQHSFQLNVKLPENQAWIFTRQKLEMDSWPEWNTDVTIRTWLRPPQPAIPFVLRDYEIFVGDKRIGIATSSFSVMDKKLRKLANVDWSSFPPAWRTDEHHQLMPKKIATVTEAEALAQFEVRNSDIDLNHHVNNVKYAQWLLDSLPMSILTGELHLKSYEVNFLNETKLGDVISVQHNQAPDAPNTTLFQGLRTSDNKFVFSALIESE